MELFTFKLLYVIFYLIIDISYVLLSKPVYEGRIIKIQGSGFIDKPWVLLSAIASYLFLAIGWWILVAERITKTTPFLETLRIIIPYALVIYGVFNTTLYVMFKEWNTAIFWRDIVWGVSSLTIITLFYQYLLGKLF